MERECVSAREYDEIPDKRKRGRKQRVLEQGQIVSVAIEEYVR